MRIFNGRRITLSFMLLLTSIFFGYNIQAQEDTDRGYIVTTGQKAPDFTVTLDNGEAWTLSEHRGKVVMLQFTASWCSVCRKEMPFIEKDIHKAFYNEDFIVIGIDRDEPLEKVLKFKKQTGITYPLALDPGAEVFQLYAHKRAGVTRNVIIDKHGDIIYLTRLYDEKEFKAMLEKIENAL